MTKNKRIFSMLLAIVMVINLVTPFNVFAAGAYGENYPPYSGSYPNSVIVRDNGNYYAYQTSSLIYYANDAKYLMVEAGSLVRRYVWKNNSWQPDEPGYTYAVNNPIGRTVTIAGRNVVFYNITNDMVGSNMKTFDNIVDCNTNITNYNLNPDSTESLNQFSTPQEIANFGVAMMPSIYDLVTFTSGDSFESIRGDFSLSTLFTVGELQYEIEWESKNKKILEVNDEEFVGGTRSGVQTVSVHRGNLTSGTECVLIPKVRYVGNPEVYASVIPSVKFHVEPMSQYLPDRDENEDKLWMKDVDISEFFTFGLTGEAGGPNRVNGDFYIGSGDSDVKIISVLPVKITDSQAGFDVYRADPNLTVSQNGYYDQTGTFQVGSRPYYNLYYSVENDGSVTAHNNFYEDLYQDYLVNPENRCVIEKVERSGSVYYTLADGRVILLDGTEKTMYYTINNDIVVLTDIEPAELIDSEGNPINKGDSAIRVKNDKNSNKINQFGDVINAAVNSDETWVIVPKNTSTALNYAELQLVFTKGTSEYIYSAPFIVSGSSDLVTAIPDPTKYNKIDDSLAVEPIALFAEGNDQPIKVSINKFENSTWTPYSVDTEYYPNLVTETLDGNNFADIPGVSYNGFDITLGKPESGPSGSGYVFKVDVLLNSTVKALRTSRILFEQLGSNGIQFRSNDGTQWINGISIPMNELSTSTPKTFYMFIPETYKNGDESIIDVSWENNVTLTFKNDDRTYTNNLAAFTKKPIARNTDIISDEQRALFDIAGYTQTGWKSTYYDKTFTLDSGVDSLVGNYVVPPEGDTLTAVYEAKSYTLSFDTNKGSGSTEPSTAPASKTINYNATIGTLETPTRDGYTFDGWYTSATGGNKVETTSKYTYETNITLYAHWTPVSHTFEFMNGATSVKTKTVAFDAVIIETADNLAGADFVGWKVSGTTPILHAGATFTKSILDRLSDNKILLEAVFSSSADIVNYDANGGVFANGENVVQTSITDKYVHPANDPTRSGYTFTGWYTSANDGEGTKVENNSNYTSGGAKTLYAHWTNVSGASLNSLNDLASMMAATNSLGIFSAASMRNLYSALINKTSAKAPRAITDIAYNHMYMALVYPKDIIDKHVYKVSLNMKTGRIASSDMVEIANGSFEIPYEEGTDTIYTTSNGTWTDVLKNYFGVKVSNKNNILQSTGDISGTIKSTIGTLGENVEVYFVGYVDNSNNVHPVAPTAIGSGDINALMQTAGGSFPDSANIALFYLCNTSRLATGAGVSVSTKIVNGSDDGYSAQVFKTLKDGIDGYEDKADFGNVNVQTVSIPLSVKKDVAVTTAFAIPEVNTMRVNTATQIGKINELLMTEDVSADNIDMLAGSSFNWDVIKAGLETPVTTEEGIFTADNLNDYSNSSYFIVSVNNPNNSSANVTLKAQDSVSSEDKVEFVGYIAMDGTTSVDGVTKNIIFHKTTPSSTFALVPADFNGVELNKLPVIRVATTKNEGEEAPFGTEGLIVKADSYTLTLGGEVFALPTEQIFNKVTFKVIKNTISSYVDRIASYANKKDEATPLVPELGDYFFIKLGENDTLYDLASGAKLVTYINGATINWTVNIKSGGSSVRLTNGTDFATVNITRLGNTPTEVEFVGTVSYDADSMSSSKVIKIPATIPAATSNLQTSESYRSSSYQYVGGYIKIGNDIRVSNDETLSGRFGSANMDNNTVLNFNIDKSQVNDYSIFVTSMAINGLANSLTNGFAIGSGANAFELRLSEADSTPPMGSTTSGNWIEAHPNTLNFNDSFVVGANNYTRRNFMEVNFVPVDINTVKDGVVYKVKTYENKSLFLGKYPVPDVGSDKYIVMDYGEYVVLFTTTGQWTIDALGIHPAPLPSPDDKIVQGYTVKAYVAPNWEHLATINNVGYDTTFENFNTDVLGDVGNLLFSSQFLNTIRWDRVDVENPRPGEKPKYQKVETTVITPQCNVSSAVPLYTRAFYAPGVQTDANSKTTLNGVPIDLYKTSDLTYLAVNTDDYQTAYLYNATEDAWTTTTLANLRINDLSTLNGFQRITGTEEVKTVSDNLMPKAHVSLPLPWNVTGGSNAFALDIYVDLYGAYHLVSSTDGGAEEYILNKYSWIAYSGELVQNNEIAPVPDGYQKIAHYDKSALSDIVDLSTISWQAINTGSVPNLPRPPINRENAIMVYDGEYRVYASDSPIYIDSNSKSIYSTTAAVLTCYHFGSMGWETYPNGNVTAQVGEDGKYYTGFYQGDVVWTNLDITTETGTLAMPGQGVAAFSYTAEGFNNMVELTNGQDQKQYYIWDKTSPTKSIMYRLNPEADNIAPVLKPVNGLIESANNGMWDNTNHEWSNVAYDVDAFIPSYLGVYKFAKLGLQKEMTAKSWDENELQDDGSYKGVTHSLQAFEGSSILMNAANDTQYETNIPNGKWFDTNQLSADITKPIVDYGYMYQNNIYWVGHDDETNSATQIVSGLGIHPYGIRFDTMFPYALDFTAWLNNGNGWDDGNFSSAKFEVAETGSASYVPSGTELWFDDPIQLSIFNYNMSFDVKFTVFVRDDAGNVSDAKTVTIPAGMEDTKMDLGIGDLPEDIRNLLNSSSSGDRTSDTDAPTLQYVYMYRGQLYIYAEDISHEGRDVSGLAPYAYQVNSTVDRATSTVNGNASRDGNGNSYSYLRANTPIFISSPVIPIGDVSSEFALTLRVIDAAGMNGNSGPADGNITDPIVVTINRYSNNNVLYGRAPDSIVEMLEKEKLNGGDIGVDNVPPVIHAIYVGVTRDKSVLGVIATDNSGSPCEYSFDLRMSGTVDWQDSFEIDLRDGDTGVARVYVRDKSGNESSATVFVDMSTSSVVYGDPGMIPKDILDKYNIAKTDNVAPIITSVYVYNGRIYVMGYDDVALHNTAYGWRPTEDAIFSTDFVGVNGDGQPVNYYAGTLVPNGTLAFNSSNSQEIQIPMSFEVTLRDTSDNRTSMSFFVSQDNVVLYGNPPKGLEDVLTRKDEDNSELVAENDGRLQVNMHGDFKAIKWNDYDYRVQMYDSEGRLVYSVDVDEGGPITIPYYVAGETVRIVESAVTEKDGSELLSINIDYVTKDTVAPVIDRVYIVGDKLYVDAFDNIELHKKPYSFTFENVSKQMEDSFTAENSKRILRGDRVIVKVRDAAGNSSSVTVNVGKVEDKTLMQLMNPTQALVFSVGDNKTVSAWSEYFRSRFNLDPEYSLFTTGNDMFTFGEIDATIEGAGSGYIKLEKEDVENSPVIYISAKVKDDGATGRTAVVQTNSYSNFLLIFRDKLLEEFGTANGIDWFLDSSNKPGASKYQDYFYGINAGIYKVNANRDGKTVVFWFLVEDDISNLMDTIDFKTDSWRYIYMVNTTVTMKDIFDFSRSRNPDGSIERIIVEDIPDGVERKDDKITFKTAGRKKLMFLNLLNGKAYTLSCQVVEPNISIGEYNDINESWARAEISLMAQNGILEKSNDGMFKPYNPVSVKEFLAYLDRMDMLLFRETDRDNLETLGSEAESGYSTTAMELGISTKDWDYYTLNDFAGIINDATFSSTLADGIYNRPITRGEAAVLIAGSILSREPQRSNTGFNIEDVDDATVQAAAELLASLSIVTISNNSFRPNAELTRQEMAKILGGIIKYFE